MMSNPTTPKPIVFLAFANDKQDAGAGFLRGLTSERNGIRDALMKAEENDWCQVIVEPDVTIDRIFDIFQHKNYQDRIAVFHYGGHADSFELLLESATGAKSVAHSEGLVPFLARQRGLKLAFLNGCCSEAQSRQLSEAGVPAVIGTTQNIDDAVATGLSVRFYKGLAAGSSVERAWEEAVDRLKTERGSNDFRSIRLRDNDQSGEAVTWKLLFREDAEVVRSWSLPEAAQDPLFGLELPPDFYRRLPRQPFPGLRPFQRDEAALFYGREGDIRNVYEQIAGTQSAILLTGKAGVGKSSLLQAGLCPRIESRYTIKYVRCQAEGLTGNLRQALQELCDEYELPPAEAAGKTKLQAKIAELEQALAESTGFARQVLEAEMEKLTALDDDIRQLPVHWQRVEAKTGRPLLLVLDQAEAPFPAFPATSEESIGELNGFLQTLRDIFNQSGQSPQGKLLLSYREEAHRPIREAFQKAAFPYVEYFLPPLNRAGIIKAVSGIARHPDTQARYQLRLEASDGMQLPEMIADDLLEDQESPVAPVLQIVLSKMWETTLRDKNKTRCFAVPPYLTLKQGGAFLSDFYHQQINQLQQWQGQVVDSGLALDLLYRHTAPSGSPRHMSLEQLRGIYRDRHSILDQLIARCRDLYLLSDVALQGTTLVHSFLSPAVIQEFSVSVRPGQQAARILNQKKATGNEPLDDVDLQLVESGLEGMRSLTPEEEELLRISREHQNQREKKRRRNRRIRRGLVTVVCLFAVLAGILWRVSQHRLIESRSNELAFLAKETLPTDNTEALDIAREAYVLRARQPEATAAQTLAEVFHSQEQRPFYKLSLSHQKNVNSAVFSPDGAFLLTASEDGFAKLWDTLGVLLHSFPHNRLDVRDAVFSPNGDQLLTLSGEVVRLWEKGGSLIDSLSLSSGQAPALENFSTDGTRILTSFTTSGDGVDPALLDSLQAENDRVFPALPTQRILIQDYSYGGTARLCDWNGQILKDSLAQDVFWIDFASDGKQFLTVSVQGDTNSLIRVWDQDGRFLFDFRYPNSVTMAVFSPDGRQILTAAKDQSAKLWDFSRPVLHRLPDAPKAGGSVVVAAFSPTGSHMITATRDVYDHLLRLWDEKGNLIDSLPHRRAITAAVFSPDGRRVLSAARDSVARLWTPGASKLILLPHDGEVDFACFSADGRRILTTAQDSTVRLWTANGVPVDTFRLGNKASAAHFSPDNQRVLTVSPRDSAAVLWSEKGDSLQTFRHPNEIRTAVFSPGGRRILTAGRDSTARLWSVSGDALAVLRHNGGVDLAVFSPDGRRILTTSQGRVHIWDHQGERLVTYSHALKVSSIDFPNGEQEILTASADGTVQLRNFQGELLARYQENDRPVNMAGFSPDGRKIITASYDGYARIWWTPRAIYEWLKRAPVYRLSKEERKQNGLDR